VRWLRWAWLALCLSSAGLRAQPVFEVPLDRDTLPLHEQVEFLIDPAGQWRPESDAPPPAPWTPLRQRAHAERFGFTPATVWYRITLRAPETVQRLWVVTGIQLEWIRWVVETPGRPASLFDAGLEAIAAGRVAPQRQPRLALTLPAGVPVTVYMGARSRGPLMLPVEWWAPGPWDIAERRVLMWEGIYFGLIAGLLLYNGFIALRLREAAYRYYVGLGLAMGVYQLSSTLFGLNLLWPSLAMWTFDLLRMSVGLYGAAAMMFTDSFLRVQRFSPRLSRLLRGTAWLCVLSVIGHLVLPNRWMALYTAPLGLWFAGLVIVSGWKAWRLRLPAAGYFLVGWTSVVLAIIVRVLAPVGWLPYHPLLHSSLQLATAIEMLLLSLALADRFVAERRARAHAETQRAREQAAREQAQHALTDKIGFMAAVAHDLQQPLYALSLATESMVRRPHDAQDAEALAQMRSATQSADELLASLALSMRLERAELQPEISEFSVQEMFERIDALFAERARQAGLRWRVWPALGTVRSDPIMLERMVCNLVSNALRYTGSGSVLLSCRARTDHLLIQVWDSGPGIAEQEQSSIFEAYQRGSAARWQDKGMGLGLSIVARCARLLGIEIGLRSAPGRGSCFSLRVPLAQPGP
jgi:signal transduction histidine kinase